MDIDLDLAPSKLPEIFKRIRQERGELGLIQVCTFGTENTKSCILSSCRGYRSEEYPDGIDVDEAQYISSLVPVERGFSYSLHDLIYGNPETNRTPNKTFIKEVSKFPGLTDIMFGIEDLVCRRGIHASGVIFFDKDIYSNAAIMRAPNGALTTQWDLHQQEKSGSVKYDFLLTAVQDIIIQTIKLLQNDNIIEKELSLREIYDKYLSPEKIPQDDKKMWKALANNEVLCCFQFDSAIGAQAAKKIKPKNPLEMADANGLMRLMPSEPGAEMPLDKYVRFKKNIDLWYQEMDNYGLTKKEQKFLEPYFKQSYGVPPSQEQLMLMLMDKNICGFTLAEANEARKIVGKKVITKIPQLKEKVLAKASSKKLGEYVWKYGAGPQMGYSFSIIHALAYSFIGMQTLYLATHFNPIYWNTACIIVNSGSLEDCSEEEIVDIYAPEGDDLSNGITFTDLPDKSAKIRKTISTDYAKIAKAIGDCRAAGINVSLANINESTFGFKPDVKNNRILYGLKGMLNIGDDFIKDIITNRPYQSPKDFVQKVKPKKQAMISLIKGGAFDEMEDRKFVMAWYLWENCDKKSKLNLQNLPGLIKYGFIPKDTEAQVLARRVYEFNRYLKAVCKVNAEIYKLDARATNFLIEIGEEELIENGCLNAKVWDKKVYQKYMDVFREWISQNQNEILTKLNDTIFLEDWRKYAGNGNLSAWEMEVLCFYYHDHELKNVNSTKYGCVDFNKLPTDPVVAKTFKRGGKEINLFNLTRICGTCIAKDKMKAIVSLLTPTGVVNVKFRKEHFALFDKRISQRLEDGTKKVVEHSWFTRGSMIMVNGIRSGDNFIVKKYSTTPGASLYKIKEILPDGELILTDKREQGEEEEEEDF